MSHHNSSRHSGRSHPFIQPACLRFTGCVQGTTIFQGLCARAATVALAGWLAVLAGCASKPEEASRSVPDEEEFTPANQASVMPLRDVEMKLSRLVVAGRPVKLAGAPPINLQFTGVGRIAGQSAVNRYFGSFQLRDDGSLQWPNAAFGTTRMAGPPEAAELENQYLQALTGTTELLTSPNGVRFESADGENLVEFER